MRQTTADHHVTVGLTYVAGADARIPYKWRAKCQCGWTGLSWQWVAVDRPGGALPMALEHVGLAPAQEWVAVLTTTEPSA